MQSIFRTTLSTFVLAPFALSAAAYAVEAADTILIYEAEPPNDGTVKIDFNKLVETIDRRINAGMEKKVAAVHRLGDDRVEIRVSEGNLDAVKRIARLLSGRGVLEFRIVANNFDHKEIIAKAKASDDAIVYEGSNGDKLDAGRVELACWVLVGNSAVSSVGDDCVTRRAKSGATQILIVNDDYDITGTFIEKASVGSDPAGRPCIDIVFSVHGGKLLGKLTGMNLPDPILGRERQLAIGLDGVVMLAPGIKDRCGRDVQISGKLSNQEVQDIAQIMNSGPFPARLKRVDTAMAR